jgi:two-component system NtrC family sensor kinase
VRGDLTVRSSFERRAAHEGTMHDFDLRATPGQSGPAGQWAVVDALANASGGAALVMSTEGAVLYANDRFVEQWGPPEAALGTSELAPIFASQPADGKGVFTLANRREFEWTVCTVPPTGARAWVFRDVTALETAKRVIEDLSGRLRLLAAHTQGIIFEVNQLGRFERVWASEAALLARPAEEMLGRTVIEILGPEVGSFHDAKIRHVLETGEGQEYQYPLEVPSGRRIFACTSAALPADRGDGRSAIFWIRDITERERMKAALLQAERLASVAMLAAGVAHEINNPLAYMLLSVGRLRGRMGEFEGSLPPPLAADLAQSAELLHEGLERVRKIVADLRTFSRTDDLMVSVDLKRVLAFCIEITRHQVTDRAKLVVDFGDAPEVHANQGRLGQVFINLLVNAAESVPPGAPDMNEIAVVTSSDERGWAVVEVRDTGAGIPADIRDRIFDPFFTTKDTGTGLGLALCHRLVREIGGEITFHDRPAEGTTFRVALPACS